MGWFMGPVARLHARGIRRDDGGVQSAVLSLAFASGAVGTLMTSAAGLSFKPWERVEIFGRNAFLVVDDQFETIALRRGDRARRRAGGRRSPTR